MGRFVQNKSMDMLITIITYFDSNTDLIIYSTKSPFNKSKNMVFTGKIKDFTVLKVESNQIKFAEEFDILSMVPEDNKITIFIYEY